MEETPAFNCSGVPNCISSSGVTATQSVTGIDETWAPVHTLCVHDYLQH